MLFLALTDLVDLGRVRDGGVRQQRLEVPLVKI